MRADWYAQGVDAAEEALPGIKKELLFGTIKPTDAEVSAIARAAPKERREMAEQLRIPKENKDKESSLPKLPSSGKPHTAYSEIDTAYAELRNQDKTVGEASILETMQYAVKSMIRVCDTLFEDFPRLLTDAAYKVKVIEIMQEPKLYIQQLEGDVK